MISFSKKINIGKLLFALIPFTVKMTNAVQGYGTTGMSVSRWQIEVLISRIWYNLGNLNLASRVNIIRLCSY